MQTLYECMKKYIVLIRAYSVIDVMLLLLLARSLAVGHMLYTWHDCVMGAIAFALWGVLTLSLEAKHKHSYRAQIRYRVPAVFLFVAACAAYWHNPYSLIGIALVAFFAHCYIKKETNVFWGMTSSVWRGIYQAALFATLWSLYAPLTWLTLGVSIVVFCLLFGRNLVADVRDVAFDRLTLVVFWGCKYSYFLVLGSFLIGGVTLFTLFPHPLVVLPIATMSVIVAGYDDGFMLHRLSLMMTSFTSAIIVSHVHGAGLWYPNLLFLGIMSNFLFYEKVARPSNPICRVPSHARFIFSGARYYKDFPNNVADLGKPTSHHDIAKL